MQFIRKLIKNQKFTQLYDIFFIAIFLLLILIMLCLIPVNFGLVFGYALGALLMYFFFKVNWIVSYLFLRNKKFKLYAIFILKTTLYLGMVALILFLMYQINYSYLEHLKTSKPFTTLQVFNKPINIFAFCGGILTSFFAILLTNWVMNKNLKK
ncbi:hypothetical protein SAM46_02160 [Mycoplasmopsis verecunda]|uniref:Uncharacterized protein n=1 Tax=Mycoplasmopsis verecunda TaxID=171291 RepID=A0A1T4KKR5_9BACT|nr:hypothetical protein [Mycoplasmopsis verecunda]WPB54270.1 hypothetical protein SAM46_02160 [Mycoplasmopsis verecunda]SJZ43022.1 hypothetical protein SAMN02745154_00090 [Mycoplasmopsis verecunda]